MIDPSQQAQRSPEGIEAAVRADHARTVSSDGPQRLQTQRERTIVQGLIRGHDVLEAGIGTGRIGLALDRTMMRFTGLDACAAMLDACRDNATDADLALLHGDLASLPMADTTFDTVVSIDTITDQVAWRQHVDALLRVVRPGGRVIIDARFARSADADGSDEPAARPALHLSLTDLRDYCVSRDVHVSAIVPYGMLSADGRALPALRSMSDDARARAARLLSWTGTDEHLYECAAFVEERIAAVLTPRVTGRMIVAFDRAPAPAGEAALERIERLDRALAGGALELDWFEDGGASFRTRLADLLASERSRVFGAALLRLAGRDALPARVLAALPPQFADDWLSAQARAAHTGAIEALRGAFTETFGGALIFHGVDLRTAMGRQIGIELDALRYPSI